MKLIDADALAKAKFHGYQEIEITPSDVNAESYKRGWNDAIDAIIESTPSVEPTLYGYRIENLAFIAGVMAKENIPPEKVIEMLKDVSAVAKFVRDDYENNLAEMIAKWI